MLRVLLVIKSKYHRLFPICMYKANPIDHQLLCMAFAQLWIVLKKILNYKWMSSSQKYNLCSLCSINKSISTVLNIHTQSELPSKKLFFLLFHSFSIFDIYLQSLQTKYSFFPEMLLFFSILFGWICPSNSSLHIYPSFTQQQRHGAKKCIYRKFSQKV